MISPTEFNPRDVSTSVLLSRFVSERDEAAFAELVRRYGRIVWGVCLRILKNRCDAEDAFQTTFVLLARKAKRIRKPGSLSSWLHGVAFRTASRLRHQRRTESSIGDGVVSEVVAGGSEPYEEIALKHQIEQVDRQLNLLHEKYRTPLVLFYFDNRTASQIAVELNLTIAAVEGRLRRGRQQLKRGLLQNNSQFSFVFPALVIASPGGAVAASAVRQATVSGCGLGPENLTNPIKTGGQGMLCKALLSTAAVSLLAIGTAMHTKPSVESTKSVDVSHEVVSVDPHKVDLVVPQHVVVATTTPISTDEDEDAPQTAAEALHEELLELHDQVYSFFMAIHG